MHEPQTRCHGSVLRLSRAAWTLALVLCVASAGCRRRPPVDDPPNGSSSEARTADSLEIPVQPGIPLPPGSCEPADVRVEIRADRDLRKISELIYGVNDDVRDVERQRWTVIRLGGNRYSAYNWENNASNAGSDWQYQNDGYVSDSDEPAQPVLRIIDGAAKVGAAVIVTLSNLDYVAADKHGGGDVRQSGKDYLRTRFKRNVAAKGAPFADAPDTTDDAVYQDELVGFLKVQRPHARLLFSMDNEPDLWSNTHAEVHPQPVTYQELWERNARFAKAVKSRWPDAPVLGFVSFGWGGMTDLQSAKDANGKNFTGWYLDRAHDAERKSGIRLIDYLDVHWYPESTGDGQRIVSNVTSPAVVEAREQSPRSLWDSTYLETSWITRTLGRPLDLLHWLQRKVSGHYPGTRLAFTEWNFGGPRDVSGALAAADVLGAFGRYGVGLATYWPLSLDEPYPYAAFRIFRNYDGRGGHFGDVSMPATTSDTAASTVWASYELHDPNAVSVVLVNKSRSPLTACIRLWHPAQFSRAVSYVLTGEAPEIVVGAPLGATGTNSFRYTMPTQSVSMLVPMP